MTLPKLYFSILVLRYGAMGLLALSVWLLLTTAALAQPTPPTSPKPPQPISSSAAPSAAPAVPATESTGEAAPPAAPAPPAVTYKDGIVKIGSEFKKTLGRVADVDKGDNGCYLTLRDDKNIEFIEVGTFDLCSQKPPLKGQRVELVYRLETIAASSCYGDPKCKKTETVPLVVKVNIQN